MEVRNPNFSPARFARRVDSLRILHLRRVQIAKSPRRGPRAGSIPLRILPLRQFEFHDGFAKEFIRIRWGNAEG